MTESINQQHQISEDTSNKQKHIQKITGPIILMVLTSKKNKLITKMNEYTNLLKDMSNNLHYSEKKIMDLSTSKEISEDEIVDLLKKIEVFLRPFQERLENNQQGSSYNISDKAKKLSDEEYEELMKLYEEYNTCQELYKEYMYVLSDFSHSQLSYYDLQRKFSSDANG